MAVHHAVSISRQRNSGYRPSRIKIMAQGFYTPDPSVSPTHLSIRRGHATTTHYTHHQVNLVVSRNTAVFPSLGLRTGPACEAGLSVGMRRERVPPRIRKKDRKKKTPAKFIVTQPRSLLKSAKQDMNQPQLKFICQIEINTQLQSWYGKATKGALTTVTNAQIKYIKTSYVTA